MSLTETISPICHVLRNGLLNSRNKSSAIDAILANLDYTKVREKVALYLYLNFVH